MADRYWVGGTAAWNATVGTKWAASSGGAGGETVPTAADDVYFDANSGSGTVSLASGVTITARSVNFTGFTGTFTTASTSQFNIGDGTAGTGNIALKLVPGMTFTASGGTMSFLSTSGTQQTIAFAGKTLNAVTFNGAGGSWITSDAMTTNNAFTFTAGTLDLNGLTHSWSTANGSNSNVRTLTMTNATINLTSTAAGNAWNFNTTTNMTLNATGSTIAITTTSANNRAFLGGNSLTYGTLDYTVAGSTGQLTITAAACIFDTIKFSDATNARTLLFGSTSTTYIRDFQTGGGSGRVITLGSSTGGTQRTIAKYGASPNPWSFDYMTVTDIIMAQPYSMFQGANSTNGGNNTNVNFTSPPSAPLIRQSREVTGTANNPSLAYISSVTAGQLLIVHYRAASNPGTVTGPANFSPVWDLGTAPKTQAWYKVADGTETTISVSTTNSVSYSLYISEYTGFTGTPTLDVNGTNSSAAATSLLIPSAPLSPTAVPAISVGFVAGNSGMGAFSTIPTNSYQEDYNITSGTNSFIRAIAKPLTAIANQDSTVTWTTSRTPAGGMATFYSTSGFKPRVIFM